MIVLFWTISTKSVYCQVYDYPVKSGSVQWIQLKSHGDMIKVCRTFF